MDVRHVFLAVICLGLQFVLPAHAADEVAVPQLKAHVTDLTHTLTPDSARSLESKLVAFEDSKGSQIAVLIVPTTKPETIEQYGIRVADAWKLGRKGVDDGLILLVAKMDRTLRIEVGYGLEGVVPDAVANRVVEEVIVPRFKAGDFAGGIDAGVDQLIRLVNGEPLPPPAAKPVHDRGGSGSPFVLLVPVIIAAQIFRSMFGPLGGSAVTAGLGFLGGWLLGGLGMGFVVAVLGFILALSGIGGRGGGWISGGGGGSGGGFGGGFSGGGGGFGGGGASGRW